MPKAKFSTTIRRLRFDMNEMTQQELADRVRCTRQTIIALEAGQPIYLAGGFGGVTMDIIQVLGVDDGSWFPVRPDAPAPDERLTRGLGILADMRKQPSWTGLENGLSDDENRKLAATHRPSEIAALISLGLGRRFIASGDR